MQNSKLWGEQSNRKMIGLMQLARPEKVEAIINDDGDLVFTVNNEPAKNSNMTLENFKKLTASEVLTYIGVEYDDS